MNKKIAIPLAMAAVVGVLIVAAYMLYPGMAPVPQGSTLPKYPAVVGTYQSSSDTSVTIALQDARQQTFAVSSTTKVVSQVAGGELGKTLGQFAAGASVQVQPSDKDKREADMVLLVPEPVIVGDDRAGPSVTFFGPLVATTTASISISTPEDPSLHIALGADTVVYSNALAGHKGASLQDVGAGTYVQVVGVVTAVGVVAHSIQLLVPLVQ